MSFRRLTCSSGGLVFTNARFLIWIILAAFQVLRKFFSKILFQIWPVKLTTVGICRYGRFWGSFRSFCRCRSLELGIVPPGPPCRLWSFSSCSRVFRMVPPGPSCRLWSFGSGSRVLRMIPPRPPCRLWSFSCSWFSSRWVWFPGWPPCGSRGFYAGENKSKRTNFRRKFQIKLSCNLLGLEGRLVGLHPSWSLCLSKNSSEIVSSSK